MGVHASFAALLDYPDACLPGRLEECLAEVVAGEQRADEDGEAVSALLRLRAEAARLGVARMEEAYTAAFDLDPGCSLYAGHHLFGETQHRSVFMSRLAAMYRDAGFAEAGTELPDYLPTLLRFVDRPGVTGESRAALIDEAIVPAARAIAAALERRADPYRLAFQALLAALGIDTPATAATREGTTT